MPLDDFDDAAERVGGKADLKDLPAKWMVNGFYTLNFPDGSHRTFRVRTEPSGGLVGKRTIALLIGPDNSSDYETFSFLEDDGPKVWKRFRGHRQEQHAAILWDLAKGEKLDGYELNVSRRCLACNRPLTARGSIELNYGPLCAERLGL